MSSEHEDKKTDELWLVPYSDLMTILALFFLSLYGFAASQRNAGVEQSLVFIQKEMAGSRESLEKLEIKAHEARVARDIEGMLSGLNKDDVAFSVDSQRFRVTLAAGVLFDSGSDQLKPEAKRLLKEIGGSLAVLPNPVVVEGHTDDVPIGRSSRFKSNWDLSMARAFAVIRLFQEEGLPSARLSALGYAQFEPIASDATPAGRSRNRRIEISLLRSDASGSEAPAKPAEAPSPAAPSAAPSGEQAGH